MRSLIPITLAVLITRAEAQDVLFDFENATLHAPLPISLTSGGITANFSATGQGYSIQMADVMGFTPVGFSGRCIYPSSVYLSDLRIGFSHLLTGLSILYAPDELACDSSATMRVTAYRDGAVVGTATTNAAAGTWPSEILQFHSTQTFNSVVVHYDKGPVTGGDWGPIFMVDNLNVTLAPIPIVLTDAAMQPDGTFQFAFTNVPNATFTVFATTNVALPKGSWTELGAAMEIYPGYYQFSEVPSIDRPQQFYCVRAP